MKKDELLKIEINRTVDSKLKVIWVTPQDCRNYIPAENIASLKEELFKIALEFTNKN